MIEVIVPTKRCNVGNLFGQEKKTTFFHTRKMPILCLILPWPMNLSAIKPVVEPLLRQVPFGSQEYIEAKRLLAFLDWFLPINSDLIPDNSILREFLGGSILHDFKLWQNNR